MVRSDPPEPDSLTPLLRSAALRVSLGLLLAIITLAAVRLSFIRRVEERVLDRRITMWRQLMEADTSNVAIVAIDRESLDALSLPWPLPRAIYARTIDRLRKAGAEAIGVTVVFEGSSADPTHDQNLRAVVEGFDDVVLASRLEGTTVVTPPFRCASGVCDLPLDGDGVARHFVVSPSGVDPPPICLALSLLRARYKNPEFVPRGFVEPPGTRFPVAWAGPPGRTFLTIPLKRVLEGGDLSKEVKGRLVLVGSTLKGPANDIRTPFTRSGGSDTRAPMTTVELSANVVFTLLGGDALAPLTSTQAMALVGGAAFLLFLLFGALHPMLSLVCAVFVSVLYGLGATYEMLFDHRLLPVVAPLLAVQMAWLAAVAVRLAPVLRTGRRRR